MRDGFSGCKLKLVTWCWTQSYPRGTRELVLPRKPRRAHPTDHGAQGHKHFPLRKTNADATASTASKWKVLRTVVWTVPWILRPRQESLGLEYAGLVKDGLFPVHCKVWYKKNGSFLHLISTRQHDGLLHLTVNCPYRAIDPQRLAQNSTRMFHGLPVLQNTSGKPTIFLYLLVLLDYLSCQWAFCGSARYQRANDSARAEVSCPARKRVITSSRNS